MVKSPGGIKNKIKRSEVYKKFKAQKKIAKKRGKEEREKEAIELGEELPKQVPRTIENTRVINETFIEGDDGGGGGGLTEIEGDEADDEFAQFFVKGRAPKVMLSTRPKCSRKLYPFIGDLMQMIPNAFYYPRGEHLVADMIKFCNEKEFSHLMILSEKQKKCNGVLVCTLPAGPTAYFKLSNFESGASIKGHGRPTSHFPEIILNNFKTVLGRRVGRFLGSMFPRVMPFLCLFFALLFLALPCFALPWLPFTSH